jgi:hypothetical protein
MDVISVIELHANVARILDARSAPEVAAHAARYVAEIAEPLFPARRNARH